MGAELPLDTLALVFARLSLRDRGVARAVCQQVRCILVWQPGLSQNPGQSSRRVDVARAGRPSPPRHRLAPALPPA
jgi:hypothetical protein